MGYYSLVVPRESAWQVMDEMGNLDCLHFDDHEPSRPLINRPFANYVKRL
jgi:V-type H+-transporting ATPase subunit a